MGSPGYIEKEIGPSTGSLLELLVTTKSFKALSTWRLLHHAPQPDEQSVPFVPSSFLSTPRFSC